jgi:hypothetical protein
MNSCCDGDNWPNPDTPTPFRILGDLEAIARRAGMPQAREIEAVRQLRPDRRR